MVNCAKDLANKLAQKPRLSLVTLKAHLTSGIKEKLSEVTNKELEMHEITFHQPEVANLIENIYGETGIKDKTYNDNKILLNKSDNSQNQVSLNSEKKSEAVSSCKPNLVSTSCRVSWLAWAT